MLPSDCYNSSQLTTRNILKESVNPEIRNLYRLTAEKYVEADTLLNLDQPKNPKDRLINKTVKKVLSDMNVLKEQNSLMNHVAQECSVSAISQWQRVCEKLPQMYLFLLEKQSFYNWLIIPTFFVGKRLHQIYVGCVKVTNKHNYTCSTIVRLR